MAEQETEYEKDCKIDLHNLHEDWQSQPEVYDKYGRKWAIAKRDKARLEEKKKTRRAKVARNVRLNPESYGLDKVTESAIDEIVRTDPEYILIVEKLIEAQKDEDLFDVAKRAMEHRREALGGEGRLYASSYFSVPNLPKEVREDIKGMIEEEREERREQHSETLQASAPRLKRRKRNDTS